jgi:predicted ABC-type ATPase
MSRDPSKLDDATHERVLQDEILSRRNFTAATTQERPKAIILAGQPGAGKGGLSGIARRELGNDAVIVDPDDLRGHHPEIETFRREGPYRWSDKTHPDASKWADELLEATISDKKNLIFDTTLSNGEWASDSLIRNLQKQGYDVEIRAMASHRLESEHGVYERFADSIDRKGFGRHVPEGARDAIYDKLPASLDVIRGRTDVPIRLFNREGMELYDSRNDARLPSVALQEAREARLQDPVVTRSLREGWREQQAWHRDLRAALPNNPRVDRQTGERLLAERAEVGVVERLDRTAQEAFDVDYTTRIRPAQIGASRALGIAGLALEAYDGAQTYRTANRLRGEGNDTAAESQLIHFGSRSVGGLGGAAIGAGAGGVATSWSGPGILVGGTVGGVIGVFGGEKFAQWTDNRRIYNQQDRSGNTWTFDPDQPQSGWQRNAPVDASNDGVDNARRGALRAPPSLANELDYRATTKSVELILGSPPPQRDPFTQEASPQDTRSSRPSSWERDSESGQWTRRVYGPFVERGMTPSQMETATPERAAQLDRAAADVVLANAANSPASIAARYEDAYIRNGWAAHGPMPQAVRGARTDIDTLVASDDNRYQRQADGRWVSDGMIYDSTASGRLHEELEASRTVLQARLPPPREIPAPPAMTDEARARDTVTGAYLNAGIEASPERIAAAAVAVRATWAANGLDPATTALSLRPDVTGRYGLDSPIGSLQLEGDARTYRIAATTGIDEIRAVEATQRQTQRETSGAVRAEAADIPTLATVSAVAPAGLRPRASDASTFEHTVETRTAAVLADNPSHPDHGTFNLIHSWVRGTGQWDEDKSRNIASALYREQASDPLLRRVDKVAGGLGRNGEESVFAVYAPYGDQGPFFHASVDGRQAGQQPAQQNLEQAEQVRQQLSQQQQFEQRQQQDQLGQRVSQMTM